MRTQLTSRVNLLSLCLPDPPDWSDHAGWMLHRTQSAREAMQTFRKERQIELLLSSMQIPDMPLWRLISGIRTMRPRQPWMLVDQQVSDTDEIRARSLGALKVLEHMPGQTELRPMLDALREARLRSESG